MGATASDVATRHEFASVGWMEALRSAIASLVAGAPEGLRFGFCEVFTGVPAHLDRRGTGVLAWTCRVTGPRIEFSEVEAKDVDMWTQGDYEYLLPLAHMELEAEKSAEFNQYIAQGVASGKFERVGDPTRYPKELSELHNIVVRFTL